MAFVELVFSGVQPTGNLHLGNYLGAIVKFVALQQTHNCIYCVVDLHAITQDRSVWGGPESCARSIREVTASFIAAGIDPKKHIVFNQSQVAAARRARLGVQLRRPHRLAQSHDPVQGEGRQGSRERLGRPLRLSEPDGGRHPASIARPTCRSARTRSSISNCPATSRRSSTTTSATRSPSTASATPFPAAGAPDPGPGDARDEPARRHEEDVEVGRRPTIRASTSPTTPTPSRRRFARRRPIPEPLPSEEKGPRAAPGGRQPRRHLCRAVRRHQPRDVLAEHGGAQFSAFKPRWSSSAVEKLAPIAGEMKRLVADPGLYRWRTGRRRRAGGRPRRAKTMRDVKDIVGLHPAALNPFASHWKLRAALLVMPARAVAAWVAFGQHRDMPMSRRAPLLRDRATSRNASSSSMTIRRNAIARSITPARRAISGIGGDVMMLRVIETEDQQPAMARRRRHHARGGL
jgi:tryptophanyl-tRNA synthetase